MTRHPVDDAAAHALAVRRHAVHRETGTAIAHEDVHGSRRGLGEDIGASGAGVLGDVDDGLTSGWMGTRIDAWRRDHECSGRTGLNSYNLDDLD